MGMLQLLLRDLKQLGEADITSLVARTGISRDLALGMVETLVRLGKVEQVTYTHKTLGNGCSIGCCSADSKARAPGSGNQDQEPVQTMLYRIKR